MGNNKSRVKIRLTIYYNKGKDTYNIALIKRGDRKGYFVNDCYTRLNNKKFMSYSLYMITYSNTLATFEYNNLLYSIKSQVEKYYDNYIKDRFMDVDAGITVATTESN